MTRLIIESGDQEGLPFELHAGLHLVGRQDGCAILLSDDSVSGQHCSLLVSDFGVRLKDLGSANGTFVADQRIQETELKDGQIIAVGRVRLRIEIQQVRIAIPELPKVELPGPRFLEDGTPACQSHPECAAAYRCVNCQDTFCADCVHDVHLRGERSRFFCPSCSGRCDLLPAMGPSQRVSLAKRILRSFPLPFRRRD